MFTNMSMFHSLIMAIGQNAKVKHRKHKDHRCDINKHTNFQIKTDMKKFYKITPTKKFLERLDAIKSCE